MYVCMYIYMYRVNPNPLLGTQKPQMMCVAAWVWFSLSAEFVDIGRSMYGPQSLRRGWGLGLTHIYG